MRYYTLSEVANKLTKASRNMLVTQERVWQWIEKEELHTERVPDNIRVGTRPYLIAESNLIAFLQEKGWDVDLIFPA